MFPQFARKSGLLSLCLIWGGIITTWLMIPTSQVSGPSSAFAAEESHDEHKASNEHDATQDDHSGGHSGPPLDFQTDLALWSLVTFIVFVLILKSAAWGPLSDGLNAREARIRKDLDDAAQARLQAEKLLAEHSAQISKTKDEIAEMLAEARRDADDLKQDILTTAQKDAESTRQRALEEINRARDAAVKDLFDHISRAVVEATEQVIGRSMSGADQDRLIEEALSQFAERK